MSISMLAKWLAGKHMIYFMLKGFPYKDQIEELCIAMVYCMHAQHT